MKTRAILNRAQATQVFVCRRAHHRQTVAAKSAQQSHVVKQLFTGSAFLNRKAARDAPRFTFRSN
jgi:hypothetical protein